MRARLPTHEAGKPIRVPKDQFFRRGTDRFIHQTLGQRPLDVGADRIGRTAHAALTLIQDLSG